VDHPRRGDCFFEPDQLLKINPRQVFHGVVENPLGSAAVIIDLNGVRVGQFAGELNFFLKAGKSIGIDLVPLEQLYRRWATEQCMAGQVNRTGGPLAELFHKGVLTELDNAAAQPLDNPE